MKFKTIYKSLISSLLVALFFACDTPIDQRDRFFLKGRIAIKEKRYNDAIKEFEEAILKDSLFADAWNNKGVALMALEQYEEATFNYTTALQINPTAFSPRYNRSNALFEQKKYTEALADLSQLLQNHEDTAYLYLSRGVILSIQNRKEEAFADFEKAIALNPTNADAYINRGTILFERKEYEKAEADFRKALSLANDNDFAMSNLAVILMDKASYQEALDLLNKAVDKRPEQALYLANRTLVKILLNDLAGAKADMKRALFYDNKSPLVIRNQGILALKEGKTNEGFAHLQQAYQADSTLNQIHYYLGQAYLLLKDKNKACQEWRKSLEIREKKQIKEIEQYCK